VSLTLLGFLAALASASPPAPVPCASYNAAKAALKRQDPAKALPLFRACLERVPPGVPRWNVQLGVALSLQKLDRTVDAAMAYRRFLASSQGALAPKWMKRRQLALGDLTRLERQILDQHAIVDVTSRPPGASVILAAGSAATSATSTTTTPHRFYMKPGKIELHLQLAGFDTTIHKVQVAAGTRYQVVVPLVRTPPPAPKPEPTTTQVPQDATTLPSPMPSLPATSPVRPHAGAYTLMALGGISITTGAILTGLALDDVDFYSSVAASGGAPRAIIDEAERRGARALDYEKAYWALYGVGTAMLVGGILWYALTPDRPERGVTSLTIQPVDSGGVGTIRGSF